MWSVNRGVHRFKVMQRNYLVMGMGVGTALDSSSYRIGHHRDLFADLAY